MTAGSVSWEEFRRLEARLDSIDMTGTRGINVLAVQVQELAKDLAAHEVKHDRADQARAASRRWMFMALIALVAAVDGPIVTVLLAVHGH